MQGFDFRWGEVGSGRLALWHRPKLKAIAYLPRAGCDCLTTLLSEREGAPEIGAAVEAAGMEWSWIPLSEGRPPVGAAERRARRELLALSRRLDAGRAILLHCSAGMHRTGMMAYALLRRRGHDAADALARIEAMRPLTRQALTAAHLGWGEAWVAQPTMDEATMTREGSPEYLSAEVRERIARAIHERYRHNQRDRKPASDASMRSWEDLAETLRHSNRDQAADIVAKLHAIGCRIGPAGNHAPAVTFTSDEIDRLGVMEHARWVAERRAAGWTQGPVKDVERKVTPYLVGWDELAEDIREYDREAVRAIPGILTEAGFAIFRR